MQNGITIFIFSQLFPVNELTSISCVNAKCKRRLLDVRGQIMWISNSGLPYEKLTPGMAYIETVCHSCKTKYRILFQ
jgi:hypothetical protein